MRDLVPDAKPYRCPGCGQVLAVRRCPGCGFEAAPGKRPRIVAQTDGALVPAADDPFPARRVAVRVDTADLWKRTYFRLRNTDMTFRQAYGLFAHENHYWPPRTLPFMPTRAGDWHRRVKDVPRAELY